MQNYKQIQIVWRMRKNRNSAIRKWILGTMKIGWRWGTLNFFYREIFIDLLMRKGHISWYLFDYICFIEVIVKQIFRDFKSSWFVEYTKNGENILTICCDWNIPWKSIAFISFLDDARDWFLQRFLDSGRRAFHCNEKR